MHRRLTCREFEDAILDYLEGRLPWWRRAIFKLHLAMCDECGPYLAAYKETLALGQKVFEHPGDALPADVPEDLIVAVREALLRESDE